MADILTPEERAAIAAFPIDRIKPVPRGQSGIDYLAPPRLTRSNRTKWERSRQIDDTIRTLAKQRLTDPEIVKAMNGQVTLGALKSRKIRMGITK